MPPLAGLRHVRIALSPISRYPSASPRIPATLPSRSLHALHSSPLRPIINHLRLYDRSSASLHYSTRKEAEEHEHKQRNADTRAPGALVLQRLSGTNAAVSGEVCQLLMEDFMARVDKKDPAPVWYAMQWWLRHIYEAKPTRRILLTMPDEASCEAARDALQKVCNRWDGWVVALRTSYVCIVVKRDTLETLTKNLEQGEGIDSTRKALMECAVDSRHGTHAISASKILEIDTDASHHDKRESRRLLRSEIYFEKSFLVDYSFVEILDTSKESTAASSDTKNLNANVERIASLIKGAVRTAAPIIGTALFKHLIAKVMGGSDEPQGRSDRKQEQHHGESHNYGESRQKSAPEVRCSHIRAGGDVYIKTNIYNLLEGNPLSSSSPTVGNEQLSGNKDLREKK